MFKTAIYIKTILEINKTEICDNPRNRTMQLSQGLNL